jgi:predicted secreted protein
MIELVYFIAASASAPAVAPATPAEAVPPKKERMICKAEKFVGSNRTRRICLTESQWRDAREGAKDTLYDIGRGGNHQQPQGPN